MIYGYVRISRKTQSIERQIRNIKREYPEAIICQEAYTGTTMNRPVWAKLINKVKKGDTIVFDSVSRMARNSEDGFKVYEELFYADIDLIFIKEPQINTTTYKEAKNKSLPLTNTTVDFILEGINKYLIALAREQILLAFKVAQKEVDDLHQRTREGLMTARLSGKTLGRRKNTHIITKKSKIDKQTIMTYSKDFNGQLPDVEVMKLCSCSRKTYYKYKKQLSQNVL